MSRWLIEMAHNDPPQLVACKRVVSKQQDPRKLCDFDWFGSLLFLGRHVSCSKSWDFCWIPSWFVTPSCATSCWCGDTNAPTSKCIVPKFLAPSSKDCWGKATIKEGLQKSSSSSPESRVPFHLRMSPTRVQVDDVHGSVDCTASACPPQTGENKDSSGSN